jgi:Ca2+-binding RTX toxin-like protein
VQGADVRQGNLSGGVSIVVAPVVEGDDGANILVGTAGNDTVNGRGGNDVLSGDAGNDPLNGGDGNDALRLDAGNDVLDGGNGLDWVTVSDDAAATVNLSLTGEQTTGYGRDTIRNVENIKGIAGGDRLTGSAGTNVIQGEGGSDTLWGGLGSDTMTGGSGRDLLYGGVNSSRDVFAFNTTADSKPGTVRDVAHDFVPGVDDVDLRMIDARTNMTDDQAFTFTGSTASAFGVWAVASGSGTLVRADVNGDKVADFEVLLSGVGSVSAGDFLL